MIAIFGGTAAYQLNLADFAEVVGHVEAGTRFGAVTFTRLRTEAGVECLFLSRHGAGKLARSAAFVNHRAHIAGAAGLCATAILSWNGVGAINPRLNVGELVAPDDIIDDTRARAGDWRLEIGDHPQANCGQTADATEPRALVRTPFGHELRAALIAAAISNPPPFGRPISIRQAITYVCTEGPRLETPAEIAAYARLGADVVGMTLCPEVWLAADYGLPYASLCAVTNMAAGLAHLNPARDFGPAVGARCLKVCLRAAELVR
jgi:5'-methylthioadenosine phosphorylase